LFVYTLPRDVNSVFSELLTPAGVSPRQVSEIQLTEAIVELVKAGLGISVFARWAVARELRAGSLRAIPITAEGWRRHWCAAYMRQKVTPPHIVEFVRLLKLHPPGGDGVVVAGRGRRTRPRVAPSGIDGAACSRSDSPGR
jgi:LysR family transcriptional regulator for metE and metH